MHTQTIVKQCLAVILVAFAVSANAGDGDKAAKTKADLEAVVEAGAVAPVDGLSTAGQPDADALAVFAKSGYTTVIDLRTEGENRGLDEAAVVDDLGMKYVNFPIAGVDAINFENAKKLDELLQSADGPVLLHCGSANRVGALLALRKSLEGASDDEAIEYGRATGMTRLESRVREVLGGD